MWQKIVAGESQRYTLIGAGLLLLVVVAIGIATFSIGKRQGTKQQASPIPVINLSGLTVPAGQQVLGASTFSWSGSVKTVESGRIILSTTVVGPDQKAVARDIAAAISPSTQLQRWDLTRAPSPSQPESNRKQIAATDLQPGQQVVVRADRDVAADGAVAATSISVLVTPIPSQQ
ncbi:MAG: hypothetical protein V1916_00790 [Patescibacteria group bacterium]